MYWRCASCWVRRHRDDFPGRGYQFAAELDEQPSANFDPVASLAKRKPTSSDLPVRAKDDRATKAFLHFSPHGFNLGRPDRADPDRAWLGISPWSDGHGARRAEGSSPSVGRASLHRGAALQEPLGDPSPGLFRRRRHDNLTTDLSHIRNSFVIARNTAFTFKGKNVDAKEIGKELGVRYVLEGSVQRDQNRVRVNAQLIDAETGAHLWADRFEEDVADLFKLQDQVVARLANTLGYELVKAEAEKSARSKSPDAIDLTMHGWALLESAAV